MTIREQREIETENRGMLKHIIFKSGICSIRDCILTFDDYYNMVLNILLKNYHEYKGKNLYNVCYRDFQDKIRTEHSRLDKRIIYRSYKRRYTPYKTVFTSVLNYCRKDIDKELSHPMYSSENSYIDMYIENNAISDIITEINKIKMSNKSRLVMLDYLNGNKQEYIYKKYGITQSRVNQIISDLKKIVKNLAKRCIV